MARARKSAPARAKLNSTSQPIHQIDRIHHPDHPQHHQRTTKPSNVNQSNQGQLKSVWPENDGSREDAKDELPKQFVAGS